MHRQHSARLIGASEVIGAVSIAAGFNAKYLPRLRAVLDHIQQQDESRAVLLSFSTFIIPSTNDKMGLVLNAQPACLLCTTFAL